MPKFASSSDEDDQTQKFASSSDEDVVEGFWRYVFCALNTARLGGAMDANVLVGIVRLIRSHSTKLRTGSKWFPSSLGMCAGHRIRSAVLPVSLPMVAHFDAAADFSNDTFTTTIITL